MVAPGGPLCVAVLVAEVVAFARGNRDIDVRERSSG
jgi:hypothetical protein